MLLAGAAIVVGFVVLVWGADRFVDGAAATAKHAGMSSLLIGMVIVGFGTSAPEMVVSAMAAIDGSPNLALGNALGSNIVNTGLILGITALVVPLEVNKKIVRKELPLLLGLGLLLGFFLWDQRLLRWEAAILLTGFFVVIGSSVVANLTSNEETEDEKDDGNYNLPLGWALFWLAAGFVLLIVSSRILVWGAVTIAQQLGVSDLIIGLTIVALGTSLPELAASVIAAKKGEHDIAIGNVVGSNMFNLLAVVGIAGVIEPLKHISDQVLVRDWPVMMGLIAGLLLMALFFNRSSDTTDGNHQTVSRITRVEGAVLLLAFALYNGWLLYSVLS